MKFDKIINGGAVIVACMHIICCGLPALAAILGAASPIAGIFSPALMNVLLAFAGVSVAVSWVMYFCGCACHKKLLIVSTVLFACAIAAHFVLPAAGLNGVESCH